jgi:hypothetical protein
MPDFAGPLQRLVLSRTLWLVVFCPLAGAVWQVAMERRRAIRGAAEPGDGRRSAIVSLLLTDVAILAHAVLLTWLRADERALFEPLAASARIGQLDAGLALWFDPTSAVASALACAVALGGALRAPSTPSGADDWRVLGWIHLALAGALVSFLADGFVTTAVGWSMASAAAAWLAGQAHPRAAAVAAARGALATAALLVGAAILFFGLGGGWDGDEYAADAQPQFVAVRAAGWESAPGEPPDPEMLGGSPARAGSVTLTSAPGARVFVDDARKESLRAPFVRVAIRGGHTFRIRRGDAADDAVVGRVAFERGDEIALVGLGPTLTFRGISDELALRDRHGQAPVSLALAAREGPAGIPIVPGAFVAWLFAAAAMSLLALPIGVPRGVAAVGWATAGPLGPFLLARLAPLAPLVPCTAAMLAWLSGPVVILITLRSLRLDDAWLLRGPERLGALVASMDRWVLGASAGALGAFARAGAWLVAAADVHLVSSPADAVARRFARARRWLEPVVGVPLASLVFALLGALALAALLHAVWPGG